MAASTDSSAAALRGTPPASNPGADDATAGIADGAGGVSGAAHAEIPNPNPAKVSKSEKRKSVFGSLKGFMGLERKQSGGATTTEHSTAQDAGIIGAATAAVAGTVAAVTETVQHLTIGSDEHAANIADSATQTVLKDESLENVPQDHNTAGTATTAAGDVGGAAAESKASATGESAAKSDYSPAAAATTVPAEEATTVGTTTDGAAESTTAGTTAAETATAGTAAAGTAAAGTAAGETTTKEAATEDIPAAATETSAKEVTDDHPAPTKDDTTEPATGEEGDADGEHKPPQAAHPHNPNQTNPDAIPTAGGKKLGEDHEGEEKVLGADPVHPTAQEKAQGAVPTPEASGADSSTDTPSSSAPGTPKDKGKGNLLNKLKDKMKSKNKK